jgi:translation initiation factor IF-1
MSQVTAEELLALFDPVMQNIECKLEAQYTANRLRGTDYATVYAKALEAVLGELVQLILGADQRALTAAKVLTEEQTRLNLIAEHAGIDAKTALTNAEREKTAAEILLLPKEGALKDQQLINLVEEKRNIIAKTDNTIAETANVPLQGDLIRSQIIGSGYENELKHQEGLKMAAEVTLVPKQGYLLDQQANQLIGENSLIPKKSQLMDAQIIELINRNKNLDLQAKILELQGNNLVIEGRNATKQGLLIDKEIELKGFEAKNLDATRKEILTRAEANRANAIHTTIDGDVLASTVAVSMFKVMADSGNTYMAHTPGAVPVFDKYSISSAATAVMQFLNRNTTPYFFI